jgi:HK97 family phage portal protein
MGFLSQLRPKARIDSESIYRLLGSAYGGGSTSTGIAVNSDSAMRAMAVQACVTIKANSLAQLPCHVYRQVGKIKEQAKDFYLYELLHNQPNSWMTAPEFWGMVSACLDLRGNFFAIKSGIPGRPIRELIPLAIGSVQDVIQTPNYELFYKVLRPTNDSSTSDMISGGIGQSAGGIIDTIPGDRIMHLRGLVLNGYMGLNPIAYARESIGLALATEKHGAKLFGHGTMIGGVLSMPPGQFFKDRTQAKKFLDDFNDTYSSVENAHKAALLENGVTWTKMGMTSVDSQFLEARNYQKREILDLFFSMPLSMLQTGEKTATYASAEQFGQQYVTYSLMPRIVNIEKAIRRDLLTPEERKTYFAKFSAMALARGDIKSRFDAYAIGIEEEVLCPNEVRDWEDLNPVEGGDTYRTRKTAQAKPDAQQGVQP